MSHSGRGESPAFWQRVESGCIAIEPPISWARSGLLLLRQSRIDDVRLVSLFFEQEHLCFGELAAMAPGVAAVSGCTYLYGRHLYP